MKSKIMTPYTKGEIDWDENQDIQYFQSVYDSVEVSQDRYAYLINRLSVNLEDYESTVNRAIVFLSNPRPGTFLLLPVEGQIEVLGTLMLPKCHEEPSAYQSGFWDNWLSIRKEYLQAQEMRNIVLCRYVLTPDEVWLRDLIDLDDLVLGAALRLEEFMNTYERYVRLTREFGQVRKRR